jgi:hypothetical protein
MVDGGTVRNCSPIIRRAIHISKSAVAPLTLPLSPPDNLTDDVVAAQERMRVG